MSQHRPGIAALSASLWRRVDQVCNRFEDVWKAGQRPQLTDYLTTAQEPERALLLRELLVLDLAYRRKTGETPTLEDYRHPFSEHAELVEAVFRDNGVLPGPQAAEAEESHPPTRTRPDLEVAPTGNPPVRLGRYQITAKLGAGGFGVVYRGYDHDLRRDVAIKVPHRNLVSRPADVEAYLTEARTVANLDHPHIVPVYDVGSSQECGCFIVSRFIEGSILTQKIKEYRFSLPAAAELVATIAAALHYAHGKGLVHRDIKPSNIVLDTSGKPFVVDFGLALKEEQVGQGPRCMGTPAYMSPEQARGEGHRVDGRSDIFSLGVVFYELLTGKRPFKGTSQEEVLSQIILVEPRPPRQVDDTIPKELERICLKALAKRASERYTTAKDLADDLRHFLSGPVIIQQTAAVGSSATHPGQASSPSSGSRPVPIVPKGLRSFDAHDADFFLELLPGPRDRDGLPASLRFWKTRIEERDPDQTFAVGLLYGPSGCGKSSLVKAGLLPRLSDAVLAVYLEATAEGTETRLLNGLRKRCPGLPSSLGMKAALEALRHGQGLPPGKKVLLVLDQFEQWLHARREEQNTELVQALRQCDGERVQCLVMVRDDFWMAATRFMRELEIRLVESQNSAAVDLFDKDHARKVLAAFGRAFGKYAESSGGLTREQRQFLVQAVAGLAQERKVICVRLTLFAEMMKDKPWTLAALREGGGTEGVGVTFLEDTFSSRNANPKHRLHQKAARAILKALLPDSGTDIKGHMRSAAELLAVSRYGSRPRDFADLIRLLDSELRLITLTDPEDQEEASGGREPPAASDHQGAHVPRSPGPEKHYQLTHDYLVPSLRDWLTRKQKETRRGRAELLLADRAAVWNARPENRQLPTLAQWLNIRLLTRRKNWTEPERRMMRKATSYLTLGALVLAALMASIGWAGYEGHGRFKSQALRDRLLDANTADVPAIVRDLAPYRRWLDPLLREDFSEAEANGKARQQLHAGLALLPVESHRKDYLARRLLDAAPHEVVVLRQALSPHRRELLDTFWTAIEQSAKGHEEQRLRAACALANYDPDSRRWARVQDQVANDLVAAPAVYLAIWMPALRPVRGKLQAPLAVVFRDAGRRETERSVATDLLADYAADQPEVLADLLLDAGEKQFAVLYPRLKEHGECGLSLLHGELDKQLPADAGEDAREKLARRQANAAVALLRMGRAEKVWPLLAHSPDPRRRSYLIHRLGPMGVEARALVKRLEAEPDVTIWRALVLSLGEFGEKEFAPAERAVVVDRLRDIYRTAPDPGLHGAAEWLLRQWQQGQWLEKVDEEWAMDTEQRANRVAGIRREAVKEKGKAKGQWYVNNQGQTMVVLPGPVEFQMGSPPTEAGRLESEERPHQVRIDRTFALAAKPVTVNQFMAFRPSNRACFLERAARYAPTTDCPAIGVTWYEAAAYCNWLSEKEGIPPEQWCYETVPQGNVVGLKEKYLSLTGYRLPTEAEMEYACRAEALTSRYYGNAPELLGKYGWYAQNSGQHSWPVGSLKPNDFGLFDMHGNVLCWCQERKRPYPQARDGKAVDDVEDVLTIDNQERRVLRGGSFYIHLLTLRSAGDRYGFEPLTRVFDIGFRPARTVR